MARIVVAASPLSGHVLPMVLIGAHLHRLGHDVVVLTGGEYRDAVARFGLGFALLDHAARPRPGAVHRLLPGLVRRYLLGLADMRSTFVAPLEGQYRALAGVLETARADAVIVDVAFTGALPLVTSTAPRPAVVVCGVGPLTLSSADTPPFGMSWVPRPGMDYTGMHSFVNRIMFTHIHNGLDATLGRVGAPALDVSLMDWPRLADRLVQLTVAEFEYPRRDLPTTVEFVGPVLTDDSDGFEPPQWWGDLLGADKVVLVTQGTLDNDDLDQLIGPTLAGLADADGVVVVATTGRRDRRPSSIPSNAYVAEWIPYSVLLPHVDVMVTNGGYGGVQHALRHGIPVVVGGESADKAEIAARVVYAGIGVNLKTAHPTPGAVAAAVRDADTHRDAARRLGRRIAQSTPLDTIAGLIADELAAAAGRQLAHPPDI